MALRRLRGFLLRIVRRRRLALVLGLALALPAGWVEFSGRYGAWWVEGLALVSRGDRPGDLLDRPDRREPGLDR
jgi:hypothetical protein